ncbi:hypothetical protein OG730_15030 [Streptomyces sp. NBC_01298]|uniref:hypothetical protein n=1 Tax=Streptomyces sp. NBC_01298 TaxID=2903817 RepID=UPI002E15606F|nr:hypothetical protein OG730_15030 [Streptomyces sp. NBC_01298]
MPDTHDYINSGTQLLRALCTYTTMAARLLKGHRTPRFRVLVRAVPSGELIGHYEWAQSAESGKFFPATEPWTHWPADAPTVAA